VSTKLIIITADWTKHKSILRDIRKTVFIDEQSVPAELEWDEFDIDSTHFLVTADDEPVATGRLKVDGQIGRMAVIKTHRRQGVGSRLLDYILDHAKKCALKKVYCHAQVPVIDFYLKKGFEVTGKEFLDANIPHKTMFKKICY